MTTNTIRGKLKAQGVGMKALYYILSYEVCGAVLLHVLKLHRNVFLRAGQRYALTHRFSASPECTLRPFRFSRMIYLLYGLKIRVSRIWILFAGIWISALIPALFLFDSSVSFTVAAACAFVPAGSLVSKCIISRSKSCSRAHRRFLREERIITVSFPEKVC